MAIPRVFVSSTCYDLKYIRENIKFFIKTIGYDPVLSDEGDVFYNPRLHTHDSCLEEVITCQIFVLIIGGRYGGTFKDTDKSITNKEYEQAVKSGIPVFALVENSVFNEHNFYNENKRKNKTISVDEIIYPSVDNIKIFEFIDEVRKSLVNNAISSFKDFSDIEVYLKKQWAGMMYYYITSETESKKTNIFLETINEATKKIEFITSQIASSQGGEITKLSLEFYDYMIGSRFTNDLIVWNKKITPIDIIKHSSLKEFINSTIQVEDDDDDEISITWGGPPYKCSKMKYINMNKEYDKTRDFFLRRISESNLTAEDFFK